MAKITIPKQVFKLRKFTGQQGQDVKVTGFTFIKGDVHYDGEAIGDEASTILTALMEAGAATEIPDDNLTFNERFGNWKIKFPRGSGSRSAGSPAPSGSGYTRPSGGGYSARKYEGEKMAPDRWMEVTKAVYVATIDMMRGHLGWDIPIEDAILGRLVEQARAMTSQFWICVEQNMIDLTKPLPSPLRTEMADKVKEIMGGGEVIDVRRPEQEDLPVSSQDVSEMAIEFFTTQINEAKSQAAVTTVEAAIRANKDLEDNDRINLLTACMSRKKALVKPR